MKILTIDVGLNNLGIALFSSSSLEKTILFKEYSKDSVEKRLFNIFNNLESLIQQEFTTQKDNYLVYEIPYFSFNSSTGKVLDYVVGLIHLLAYKYNLTLVSYSAKEVKKAIGIKNNNTKQTREQNKKIVLQVVESILKLDLSNKSDHEIDGIAIGICFLHKIKEEQNAGNKTKRY